MPYKDPKKQAEQRKRWAAKAKAADPEGFAADNRAAGKKWREGKGKGYHEKYQKSDRMKAYQREWHLKKKYGLTQAEFEELLAGQGWCCAICLQMSPDQKGFMLIMTTQRDEYVVCCAWGVIVVLGTLVIIQSCWSMLRFTCVRRND